MTLKPFFSFYGSKWRVAPRYPAPWYNRLVEPFAGSAGYALRYPHLNVQLNDADPVIAGLWKYLIRVSADEIRRLPIEFSHVDDLNVCDEAKSLIGFWLNKASTAPCKSPGQWMRSGRYVATQFWGAAIRERVASQLHAIRHWTVTNQSYKELDTFQSASWFVDPPYARSGVHYRHSDIDYVHLAQWCRDLPGQVIVCEQEGADWLPFSPFAVIQATFGRGKGRSSEVIWTP